MWDRRARLVRIKDGDTIVVVLDQGFRNTEEIDVRLYGCTPRNWGSRVAW